MIKDDLVTRAKQQIVESRALGLDFIVLIYNNVELPCLREIADNLSVEPGQEMTDEQMLALTRAHQFYTLTQNGD